MGRYAKRQWSGLDICFRERRISSTNHNDSILESKYGKLN